MKVHLLLSGEGCGGERGGGCIEGVSSLIDLILWAVAGASGHDNAIREVGVGQLVANPPLKRRPKHYLFIFSSRYVHQTCVAFHCRYI